MPIHNNTWVLKKVRATESKHYNNHTLQDIDLYHCLGPPGDVAHHQPFHQW